jgi:hypothetical protein
MKGDARVRFCDLCKLNVYDLSAMTRADAENLVREREGRLCARFFRRDDGTILTQDCPVGVAARLRRATARVVASFIAYLGLGSLAGFMSYLAWGSPFGSRHSPLIMGQMSLQVGPATPGSGQ